MNLELIKPMSARRWHKHHPAVYWAYSQRNTFDWKNDRADEQRKAFAEIWLEARKMARDGFNFHAVLPPPEPGEKANNQVPASPETAERALNEIKSMFEDME